MLCTADMRGVLSDDRQDAGGNLETHALLGGRTRPVEAMPGIGHLRYLSFWRPATSGIARGGAGDAGHSQVLPISNCQGLQHEHQRTIVGHLCGTSHHKVFSGIGRLLWPGVYTSLRSTVSIAWHVFVRCISSPVRHLLQKLLRYCFIASLGGAAGAEADADPAFGTPPSPF